MGRLRAWRRWAVTGLVLALALSSAVPRVAQVSADPGDNGVAVGAQITVPTEGTVGTPPAPIPIGSMWHEFSFTTVGVDARGCSPADPGGLGCIPGANSDFAPAPPWTFTAPAGGALLQVTDAFLKGDRFEIYDFGSSKGLTSVPATTGTCGPDPDPCFATADVSKGTFPMAAGSHSITIKPTASPFGDGAAYFRVVLPSPLSCTLTQTVDYSGGNMKLSYTLGSSVPATWGLYLLIGSTVIPVVSAPLPAISPPIALGPFSFPFPSLGVVGWLTTLTTPGDGIICADFDVVDTGPAAAAAAPRIELPLPSGENGQE